MKQFLAAFQVSFVALALTWSGCGWARDAGGLPGLTEGVGVPDALADLPVDAGMMDTGVTDSGAMTGAYFMRDTLVPRADDLALIQRKPALYLSSFNDGMATVAYSLEAGRIVYRVVSGTVDAAARDAIDRALVKLQRKVA